MSGDRGRSRLFKGDPGMLLLGDGPGVSVPDPGDVPEPVAAEPMRRFPPVTRPVDAPELRDPLPDPSRTDAFPIPHIDESPTISVRPTAVGPGDHHTAGGFVVEHFTGEVLPPSDTVFDAGYTTDGSAAGDRAEERPLRIFLGGPGQAAPARAAGGQRVWDASALVADDAFDDRRPPELADDARWTPDAPTLPEDGDELLEAAAWEQPDLPGDGLHVADEWEEEAATEAVTPAMRWDAPQVGSPSWREEVPELPEDEPQELSFGQADHDIDSSDRWVPPSGNWGRPLQRDPRGDFPKRSPLEEDSLLRPLDREDTSEHTPVDPAAVGSGGVRNLARERPWWEPSEEEEASAPPPAAQEWQETRFDQDPPPPPLSVAGTTRLERELGTHWDADEELGEAAMASGVREPWDVTASGARRRPPSLGGTGPLRPRPGQPVPDFHPLDEEPRANPFVRGFIAVVLVGLVVIIALQLSGSSGGVDPLSSLVKAWQAKRDVPEAAPAPTPLPPLGDPAAVTEPAGTRPGEADPAPAPTPPVAAPAPLAPAPAPAPAPEPAPAAASAPNPALGGWEDTGILRVKTDFPATIYIDGKRVGRTPLEPLELGAGMHDVKAVPRSGGRTRRSRVRVDGGRAGEVRFSR